MQRKFGVNGLAGAVTSQIHNDLRDGMFRRAEELLQSAHPLVIAQINAQELCEDGLRSWKYRKIRTANDTRFDNEEG